MIERKTNQNGYVRDVLARDSVDVTRLKQIQQAVLDGRSRINSVSLTTDGAYFFARELEYIERRAYFKKYAEYKARECIPVDNSGGEETAEYTYRIFDKVGEAKFISKSNPTVIPKVTLTGEEITQKVQPIAISADYNVFELAAAAKLSRPLEADKIIAMRDATEFKHEKTAWIGDDEFGVQGLLTNGLIPTGNVVNGVGGAPEWDTKTPQEILADIIDAQAEMRDATNGVEQPDTVLVPSYQYSLLTQPRSDVSDTSIMNWLLTQLPWLKEIKEVPFLKGQGVGGTDRMVLYKKDPEKLSLVIPFEFNLYNPVPIALGYEVSSRATTGGTVVRYPLSLSFKDSI